MSSIDQETITREALKQLLYDVIHSEKERKKIPNDDSIYLTDVEAVMSLHDALISAAEKKIRKSGREELVDTILDSCSKYGTASIYYHGNTYTLRVEDKQDTFYIKEEL